MTAHELQQLGEHSRLVMSNALRSIEHDTARALGRMNGLLLRGWLRPLVLILRLLLSICGGAWVTLRYQSTRLKRQRQTLAVLNWEIEEARQTLAVFQERPGGSRSWRPRGRGSWSRQTACWPIRPGEWTGGRS